MKKVPILTSLGIVLCVLVFWLGGCGSLGQMGESPAEARRRHLRSTRITQQELMEDVDMAILADKPSKLTDKRIP